MRLHNKVWEYNTNTMLAHNSGRFAIQIFGPKFCEVYDFKKPIYLQKIGKARSVTHAKAIVYRKLKKENNETHKNSRNG